MSRHWRNAARGADRVRVPRKTLEASMGTRTGRTRVRRIAVTEQTTAVDSAAAPDYADAFGVPITSVSDRPSGHADPEAWARAVFEDAPRPTRWLMLFGWRVVLGARLGPRPSAEHVLGWRIVATEPDAIRLQTDSMLMTSQLVLRLEHSEAVLTTLVHQHNPAARAVWALVGLVHRRLVPYLLRRAASPAGARERILRFQRTVANPIARRLARYVPGQAVIETVGRRSGQARWTPVGGRLEGSSFWVVTEFGRHSNYVRNIAANPRVRVQLGGRWYTGTAAVLPDDDPLRRLRRLPRLNSLIVRMVGTDLLTLRIDLDAIPTVGQ